jgi:hypothetical protein
VCARSCRLVTVGGVDAFAEQVGQVIKRQFDVAVYQIGTELAWTDGPSIGDVVGILTDFGYQASYDTGPPGTATVVAPKAGTAFLSRSLTAGVAALAVVRGLTGGGEFRRALLSEVSVPEDGFEPPTDVEQVAVTLLLDRITADPGRKVTFAGQLGAALDDLGGRDRLLEAATLATSR